MASAPVREQDIRQALLSTLRERHEEDETLILDEMGVCEGTARIDVAVVNGKIGGFEIKSERDTLSRLPRQASLYGMVFDELTIVTAPRHADACADAVPTWWGVIVVEGTRERVDLRTIRAPGANPDQESYAVAQLLWRDEALALLEERGAARGLRSKPRRFLWAALTETMSAAELGHAVRGQLRARTWRVDRPPAPGGDSC